MFRDKRNYFFIYLYYAGLLLILINYVIVAIDEKRKFAASIGELRTVDSWLQKRNIVIPQYEIPQSSQTTLSTQFLLNSELPRQFPPSVQAIHLSDYMDTELFEWG